MVDTFIEVIESLYPTPEEYSDNGRFFYWMDYACELDMLLYRPEDGVNSYMLERLQKLKKDTAEHDALTDVASTLEEVLPSVYKGVFVYE
jgi:hypothetical protein